MYFSIGNVDIPALLRHFGPQRIHIYEDILDVIEFSWQNDESNNGIFKSLKSLNIVNDLQCSYVCSNLQGSKDGTCPFYHTISDQIRRKGNLIHIDDCPIKYYFYIPILK
jgi:hypothetical protein